MRLPLRVFATILFVALAGAGPVRASEPFTLDAVRENVKRKYDGVAQLSTKALSDALSRREPVLLLDVREPEEYAVSRIPGAVRVDPGVWNWSFLKGFAAQARGKKVIFYCSVGVRSSELAERVRAALKDKGALAVYNLDGGIFAWHNEARALTDRRGETRFVHPFDAHWGRLVARKELIRTTPAP